MRIIPGDPIQMMVPPGEITVEQIDRLRHIYGLDRPILEQYIEYIKNLFTGNWGKSLFGGELVFPLIIHRFKATLVLASVSILMASVIGVSLGALSVFKGGTIDSISQFISTVGYSIPGFWLGILLVTVFSVYLGWFPSIGGGDLKHLILPAISNGTWATAVNIRVSRACMLEVLNQDYITLGRAKGLSNRSLLINYILPNALIPIVTVIGLQYGGMMAGSIITERVFQYPGIGNLVVESIFKRDYPIIQATVFFVAIVIVLINLAIDILYLYLDPRVRYEEG
jgi:ABC-type dipeptide/oligopeptide/nickel transport system permease component